jgi:UDP:flavonoid glycosyltransferase YjiC (YdhE family)
MWRGTTGVRAHIELFLERNSRKMAELYGDKFADATTWGPDLAARLVLAYIERNRGDKLWYKRAATVRKVARESERKLIVCSCHTGFLSHTGRTLAVAQRLRELGHEVLFIVDLDTRPDDGGKPTQRKYGELIRQAGFETYQAPIFDENAALSRLRSKGGTMAHYSIRMIEAEAEEILRALRQIERARRKPDFMLTDAAWVACIAGDVMGIPMGSLWDFLFTNCNRTTLTLPEKFPVRRALGKLGGDRLIRLFEKARVPQMIMGVLLFVWVTPFNIVRLKYMLRERKWIGLKRNMFAQVGGALHLFPDYAAFGGMKIDHRALPVGPIVWEPSAADTTTRAEGNFKTFLESDRDKTLIYVTMGSTGEPRLFKLIIDALKNKAYRVVITTGAQYDQSQVGELPENMRAITLYPGTEICRYASLVINHGGSGSVNQAIQNRIPQLCIPTHVDQQWISDLVAREGLGEQMFPGDVTVESLTTAIEEVLADGRA